MIAGVFGVCLEGVGVIPSLVVGHALEHGGKVESHPGRGIVLRQLEELRSHVSTRCFVFAKQPDCPAPNDRIIVKGQVQEPLFRGLVDAV